MTQPSSLGALWCEWQGPDVREGGEGESREKEIVCVDIHISVSGLHTYIYLIPLNSHNRAAHIN